MTIIKDMFLVLLLFLAVYLAFYLGMRHETTEQRIARYDCRMAEFVPDFPPEVRAECRRRTLEKINQQREQ